MASINAGKLAIRPMPEDASRLLTEVIEAHEPLASERGIVLERAVDPLTGVILDCDRNRMAQALGNLLGNAVKFCRPGDVVSIRARRADQVVRIEIADTGPGIAKEALPHIFEPYWSGRREKKTGTGLGLFITKAIIEAHKGTLSVASVEGEGATFTIALPLTP
jgi:signal transduction histidine kinase